MFMKIVAPITFILVLLSTLFFRIRLVIFEYFLISIFASFLYMAYGIFKARRLKVHILNEGPNAIRFFFAFFGGFLGGLAFLNKALNKEFLFLALFCLCAAIVLNDEWMRRTIRRLFSKKKGVIIALLGIDGSGKSTYSHFLKQYFTSRGFKVEIIPYHKYIFVEKLSRMLRREKWASKQYTTTFDIDSYYKGNKILKLLRAILSLLDNFLLFILSVYPKIMEGNIVILDRFIWSTYVKYSALGYPIGSLKKIWFITKPHFAIIFDIPAETSIKRILQRKEHLRYSKRVLDYERQFYLDIAKRYNYPIIDTTKPKEVTDKYCLKIADLIYRKITFGG